MGARAQSGAVLLPSGIAYDAAGNVYFADLNRNQVFEASLGGALTVVAGNGVQGFAGDGGAAVSAELNEPVAVAVGADGTIYIADAGNARVRAVAGGVIATFAGNGVVGYAGDGGAAASAEFRWPAAVAELDSPEGVAVGSDGRVFIADAHNARIRVVGADGVMATFAGTGVVGFSGDGGPAAAAELARPRGLVVDAQGGLVFADSDNERVRRIDASGVIATLAGGGGEGGASEGAGAAGAGMDEPRGVAVSSFGEAVFGDSRNRLLKVLAANGDLYAPAALVPGRTSLVALTVPPSVVYGQMSAAVSVSGSTATPLGSVALMEGGTSVGAATLSAGEAVIGASGLGVGAHSLTAVYAGDGVNPAAVSGAMPTTVTTAPLVAVANGVTVEYGQAVPVLTGTLTGVLAQDAGSVGVVFSSGAGALAMPGTYAIAAALTGTRVADYAVSLGAGSGVVVVTQAGSVASMGSVGQGYAGLPLGLTATVASTTQGVPTGLVNFVEGGSVVATGTLNRGRAAGTYLSPAAGTHEIAAQYGGDVDFVGSTSAAANVVVGALPDFAVGAAGASAETVVGGQAATYALSVSGAPGPFTGAVSLSVTGLPTGAQATFSPAQVVPGSSSVGVAMVVTTVLKSELPTGLGGRGILWVMALPLLLLRKRRRLAAGVGLAAMLLMVGCGVRTLSNAAPEEASYTLTVTGTATNLAGAVVAHSTNVTLTVE
jgi:hypothetical protein